MKNKTAACLSCELNRKTRFTYQEIFTQRSVNNACVLQYLCSKYSKCKHWVSKVGWCIFITVTAKKVLGKKVLIFRTKKVLWKKIPRNPKHRTLFPVTFFPYSDFFSKVFLFTFFSRNFFLGTFLHRFLHYTAEHFKRKQERARNLKLCIFMKPSLRNLKLRIFMKPSLGNPVPWMGSVVL